MKVKQPKLPRVSEILAPYFLYSTQNIPKEMLSAAAERGTLLHTYCIGYARGDFLPDLEESLQPYLTAFIEWFDKNVEEVILSEERLMHPTLNFQGQPDLVVRFKNSSEKVLIDIKTSTQIYSTYPLQLAAYMDLLNVNNLHAEKAAIIKITKTGTYDYYDYDDCEPYFITFLKALELYKYFY